MKEMTYLGHAPNSLVLSKFLNVVAVMAPVFWALVWIFFNSDPYVLDRFAPKIEVISISFCCSLAIILTRSLALKIIQNIWLLWPVFGTYFSISKYYDRHLWAPLELHQANIIYIIYAAAFIFSIAFFSHIIKNDIRFKSPYKIKYSKSLIAMFFPILIFPILYLFEVLKGPNIFSGQSILYEMYQADRGIIYSFRIVIYFYAMICLVGALHSKKYERWLWLGAYMFGLVVSVFDGKRDIAITVILATSILLLSRGTKLSIYHLIGGPIVVAAMYQLISNLRNSRVGSAQTDILDLFGIVGVEYRDFAHSIIYWSPEFIKSLNYDYVKSSVGAIFNQNVLRVFGVEKNELIAMDSARAWQRAYESDFGIRIGIIGEWHYAFGSWSIIGFILLGCILVFMIRFLEGNQNLLKMMLPLLGVSMIAASILNQSTVSIGYIITSIYVIIILLIWQLMFKNINRISF